MLGYVSAEHVLGLGRKAFFGGCDVDLPRSNSPVVSEDDLTPQFGYVGDRYQKTRVLFMGINPGHGSRYTRSPHDMRMMPKLIRFRTQPSPESFRDATLAYYEACEGWWPGPCRELFADGTLALDEVAYSNCLPWRTASGTEFSEDIAERAARHYASPLIDELKPKVVVALYKRAASILERAFSIPGKIGRRPELVYWNGARAATEAVKRDRKAAAQKILKGIAI